MDDRVTIRALTPADGPGCDAVVASLPYHFGNERGIADGARDVRSQEGLVAERGGEIVGFLTLALQAGGSAEVTWMGVRADHRRTGIGRALVQRADDLLRDRGTRIVFVLTLGPSVPDEIEDGYQATRAFYEAVGFTPLREFALRSWDDEAALILVKPLGGTEVS